MKRISAIVCTHNRYDTLGDTLEALMNQDLSSLDYEVLVVDNSVDVEAQARFWRITRLPPNMRNIVEQVPGLSRARNIGLRAANSPIVAYIDDDAVPDRTWLSALVQSFDAKQEIGICGGPVEPIWVYPAERPIWLHSWQDGFLTIVDRGAERRQLNDGEWLAGTNIAFRCDALLAAGGFNEALGRVGTSLLSNEELVVSRIIKSQGWEIWYDPGASVAHRVHANRVSQAWFRRRVSWQAVSDQMASFADNEDALLWGRIHNYLSRVPIQMRGIRGLFLDIDDPELFQKQCSAIEALVLLLLASGEDPDAN